MFCIFQVQIFWVNIYILWNKWSIIRSGCRQTHLKMVEIIHFKTQPKMICSINFQLSYLRNVIMHSWQTSKYCFIYHFPWSKTRNFCYVHFHCWVLDWVLNLNLTIHWKNFTKNWSMHVCWLEILSNLSFILYLLSWAEKVSCSCLEPKSCGVF